MISRRELIAGTAMLSVSAVAPALAATPAMPEPRRVNANGIGLSVHEAGSGPAIVLLHGWPEIAYSWRRQIGPLRDAGYRVIVPDQRGYGASDRPDAIEAYDMTALSGDVIGLLDALGIRRAIIVGHDWGGIVAWQLPLLYPERIAAVVGVNTPFFPRLPFEPVSMLRFAFGDDMYVMRMQRVGEVEAILDPQPGRFFRTQMRTPTISTSAYYSQPRERQNLDFLGKFAEPEREAPAGKLIMPAEELQVYIDTYERTGFGGGINWYRNLTRNWQASAGLSQTVRCPALMIGAADDIVLPPQLMNGMESYIPDLEKRVLSDCGHFPQSEQTEAFNAMLLDWLGRRFPARNPL